MRTHRKAPPMTPEETRLRVEARMAERRGEGKPRLKPVAGSYRAVEAVVGRSSYPLAPLPALSPRRATPFGKLAVPAVPPQATTPLAELLALILS